MQMRGAGTPALTHCSMMGCARLIDAHPWSSMSAVAASARSDRADCDIFRRQRFLRFIGVWSIFRIVIRHEHAPSPPREPAGQERGPRQRHEPAVALAEMPLDDRCAATRTCVLALRGSSHCIRKPFRGRQRNRKPAGGPAERVSRPGACRHSAPRLVCCHLCAIADCCITRARERAHERGPALQARAVVGNVFLSPNGCRRAGTARFKAAMKCQYSPALRAKKPSRQLCVCTRARTHARTHARTQL
jgi:hypothetical protein